MKSQIFVDTNQRPQNSTHFGVRARAGHSLRMKVLPTRCLRPSAEVAIAWDVPASTATPPPVLFVRGRAEAVLARYLSDAFAVSLLDRIWPGLERRRRPAPGPRRRMCRGDWDARGAGRHFGLVVDDPAKVRRKLEEMGAMDIEDLEKTEDARREIAERALAES